MKGDTEEDTEGVIGETLRWRGHRVAAPCVILSRNGI